MPQGSITALWPNPITPFVLFMFYLHSSLSPSLIKAKTLGLDIHPFKFAMMNRMRVVFWALVLAVLFGLAFPNLMRAQAQSSVQDWPSKAVKIVVPYPAGGGVDLLARALAYRLQEKWQQSVTIDNRLGANTLIGAEAVAHANDPYTLLLTTDATFTINPHLYTKLPYDLDRDFSAITQLVSFSQMLVVGQRTGINSMAELMELAKAKPEALSYSSYGPGSQPQLATEIFKQKSGLSILHVPYKGIPQAIAAVVADEVSMSWSGVVSAKPYIANKRIKAVAFGGKTRSPAFPDVPTMTELGFPEVDANVWVALFGPKSMPPSLVQKIHKDVWSILNEPSFKANEIEAKGYDYSGLGPEELSKHIKSELISRKAAVKLSGVSL